VVYSSAYWLLNLLIFFFLGRYIFNSDVGVFICVLNVVFLLYEVKCLFSDSQYYLSDISNLLDALLHFACFFSTVFILGSSDTDKGRLAGWTRLMVLVGFTMRSVTFMRVFAPFRYLIRMLNRVSLDILPFLVILMTMVILFTHMWSISPTLYNPEDQPTSFYISFQVAMNLMLFNVPDSEDDGSRIGAIKFTFLCFANIGIMIILMNFLIAIISDTYMMVSVNRELYEVKELLSFIREMDTFLVGLNYYSTANEVRYVTLIPEDEEYADGNLGYRENKEAMDLMNEKMDSIIQSIDELKTVIDERLPGSGKVRENHTTKKNVRNIFSSIA
jgi:hypothetical protein